MKENVTIEQMIAFIMSMKNLIGEFSVDMYYDDVTSDDNEKYVVKLHGINEPAIHFRCKDFKEGLNSLFLHLMDKIFK
jgi:hypothetical protein